MRWKYISETKYRYARLNKTHKYLTHLITNLNKNLYLSTSNSIQYLTIKMVLLQVTHHVWLLNGIFTSYTSPSIRKVNICMSAMSGSMRSVISVIPQSIDGSYNSPLTNLINLSIKGQSNCQDTLCCDCDEPADSKYVLGTKLSMRYYL